MKEKIKNICLKINWNLMCLGLRGTQFILVLSVIIYNCLVTLNPFLIIFWTLTLIYIIVAGYFDIKQYRRNKDETKEDN